MSCGMSKVMSDITHSVNSGEGFDIHYSEFELDEIILNDRFCGKKFDKEETAWGYAITLAEQNKGLMVDIYVVYAITKKPVVNFKEKRIVNFPQI